MTFRMYRIRYIGIGVILALLCVTAFALYLVAKANQSAIAPFARTATATSTLAFMTPGTGTTTITYDSYNQNSSNSNVTNIISPDVADSAVLALQFTASSTAATYNISIEYSQDNQDWYQNNLVAPSGTTSPITSLGVNNSLQFFFASSTVGGAPITAATSTWGKMVSLSVPTRYVRAVITLATSTVGTPSPLNGAVWGAIYPKKQFPTK